MDLILACLGFVLILTGVIGSFLPVLPGPPIGWLGLLILHFTDAVPMDITFLAITATIAALIFILDYVIPALGTKKFGGSKYGMIGSTVGLLIGIVAPIPMGILIGPFVGAFIGEMFFKNDPNIALKAAFGSFIGFLASSFMKFIVALSFGAFYVYIIADNWTNF